MKHDNWKKYKPEDGLFNALQIQQNDQSRTKNIPPIGTKIPVQPRETWKEMGVLCFVGLFVSRHQVDQTKLKMSWVLPPFIASLLSEVLLPAPAPPTSPGVVSVASALVPPAPSGFSLLLLVPAPPALMSTNSIRRGKKESCCHFQSHSKAETQR